MKKGSQNKTLVYFFGGAISKALATVLTYPYQVIRTNIHVFRDFYGVFSTFFRRSRKTTGPSCKSRGKSTETAAGWVFSKVFIEISRENLVFLGLSPKLSQTVLNSAFLLLIYEKVFYFFWVLLFKQPQIKKMIENLSEQ